MRRLRALTAPLLVATMGVAGLALGSSAPAMPTPGSASEVARLVKAAPRTEHLPAHLDPSLAGVSEDYPGTYYPSARHACASLTACVYGVPASKVLVVLFGDSHAQMWLPALAPVATAAGWRLVLVWRPGCPAADVSVWDAYTRSPDAACNRFRTEMLTAVAAAHPALVLLSSRTSDVPGPGNKKISEATWEAGLERTITALASATTKVAVIGDVTSFGAAVPLPACVVAHPDEVQSCSVSNPNPKTPSHVSAEEAAAKAEGVTYLDPRPWLCSTVCSPIVGNLFVYSDSYHVDATYAEFLTGVWAKLLKADGLDPLVQGR